MAAREALVLVLILAAFLCFLLAAPRIWHERIHLGWLGAAFAMLAFILGKF